MGCPEFVGQNVFHSWADRNFHVVDRLTRIRETSVLGGIYRALWRFHSDSTVIPKALLRFLVLTLVLLLVAFAVLMAFYALVVQLGDAVAARALFWAANACLILLVTDAVLLLAALGLRAVTDEEEEEE